MLTLLTYVLALLLVGGLLFLAAAFAFGRDEEMAPALPEGTPAELPDDRPVTGADLRAVRLSVVLRGYRMEEVDWVLDRLAEQVDARDREIARLRSVLHVEPVPVGAVPAAADADAGPEPPAGPRPDTARQPGTDPERASGAAEPVPVPRTGEEPKASAVRSREQRLRGPGNPVRGLRPDAPSERDQR